MIVSAAVCGAALTFITSNYGPLTLDRGVGVMQFSTDTARRVVFSKDVGDLTCWLRLKMPPEAVVSHVRLDDGTRLRAVRTGQWWQVNSAAPTPSGRFVWFSGRAIEITGTALRVQAWELYRQDGTSDSSAKQQKRLILLIVLGVLTCGGALGTVVAAWPERPAAPTPFTPDACILEIIARMEARPVSSTARLRELMMRSLVVKDLTKMGLSFRDRGLLLQGRIQMKEHLNFLIAELKERKGDLD